MFIRVCCAQGDGWCVSPGPSYLNLSAIVFYNLFYLVCFFNEVTNLFCDLLVKLTFQFFAIQNFPCYFYNVQTVGTYLAASKNDK